MASLVIWTHTDGDYKQRVECRCGLSYEEAREVVNNEMPHWVHKLVPKKWRQLPLSTTARSFEVRAASSDRDCMVAVWCEHPDFHCSIGANNYTIKIDGVEKCSVNT